MFLLGLFTVLGTSPGSLLFEGLVNTISPMVQAAAVLLVLIFVYFLYDQVYEPLDRMFKAYRWGGMLAMVSLGLAFVGGLTILVDARGMVLFLLSLGLWKLTVRLSYR